MVDVLELDGRDHADLAMEPSVVEPVDVFRGRDLELVDARPRAEVAHQFGLEQRVEGLGQGVVIGVAGRADGCDCAGFGEALGVADGDVLDALVAVVREPGDVVACVFAGPDAHLQRVQREVGPQ